MMTTSDAALKAAKKLLKQSVGPVSLQDLVQAVAATTTTTTQVQAWIQESSKFQVRIDKNKGEKLMVSYNKKKKSKRLRNAAEEGRTADTTKAKKQKKTTKPSEAEEEKKDPDADNISVAEWRKENKIVVVLHNDDNNTDDRRTKTQQPLDNTTAVLLYHPFTSFHSPECRQDIAAALLEQCCTVNGFAKPSPIQAQAWPILTTTLVGHNRPRDVVGIAETGSGVRFTSAMCVCVCVCVSVCLGRILQEFDSPSHTNTHVFQFLVSMKHTENSSICLARPIGHGQIVAFIVAGQSSPERKTSGTIAGTRTDS
jgi:hypothetical protein